MMRGMTTSARIDMMTTTTISSSRENPASPRRARPDAVGNDILIFMVNSAREMLWLCALMITDGLAPDNRPAPLPDPLPPVIQDADPAAARPVPPRHRCRHGLVSGALGRAAAAWRGGGAARLARSGLRCADRLARSGAG